MNRFNESIKVYGTGFVLIAITKDFIKQSIFS